MDLSEKVHIFVKMIGFSSRPERRRLHSARGQNCLTLVQLYSQDFWTQSSSNFSARKTVRKKRRKQALPGKISGSFSFRRLRFRSLSFRGLSFRDVTFRGVTFQGLRSYVTSILGMISPSSCLCSLS